MPAMCRDDVSIKGYVFGTKAYSYDLVHYVTDYEELACGQRSQYGPLMRVDKDEPTTCLTCLVLPIIKHRTT